MTIQQTIESGKLVLKEREVYLSFLNTLEGEVEVIIRKPRKNRTTPQNDFMWAYLQLVSDHTGDSRNELHEYFKRILLPAKEIKVMGKTIKIPTSTTDLSTKEFGEYLERISALTDVPVADIDSVEV